MIINLRHGDCIEVLKDIPTGSVGSILCDPPYGLNFMNKSWDQPAEMLGVVAQDYDSEGHEKRGMFQYGGTHTRGYADNDNTKFRQWNGEWLSEAMRVLKVGGCIKAFSGTRTMHALGMAMEDIGFQDISLEAWTYGSGFPKSRNLSKDMDRMAGVEREVVGYKQGVGGENLNDIVREVEVRSHTDKGGKGAGAYGTGAKQKAIQIPITAPATDEAKAYNNWGTGLKPSWEPILVGWKR